MNLTKVHQKFMKLADFLMGGGSSSGIAVTEANSAAMLAELQNKANTAEDQYSLVRFDDGGVNETVSDTNPLPTTPVDSSGGFDAGLDTYKVQEQSPLWARYTDAETLVTTQDLTNSYASFGSEINMKGFTHLGIFLTADVNDSIDVELRALGLHTSGGSRFEIDGVASKVLWNATVTDFGKYYEFAVGALPYVQLQALAGTVGTTAGNLTMVIVKGWLKS